MVSTSPTGAHARPRRILMIGVNYAPEPTGIAPYTTGMAEGLARDGAEVSVITGYPHYPWWRVPVEHAGLPGRSVQSGVRVRRVRHFIPRRHNSLTRALHEVTFGMRALFTRWEPADVVVLVSPALLASWALAWKARLRRIPVITWVQDIYTLGVQQAGNGMGGGLVAAVERGLANSSDAVVVIHDRFRRMLTEDLGVGTDVSVVRNWSHVPEMHDRRDEAVRRAHGWGPDDVIVLHAGNMGAKQALENVVRASQLAAQQGSCVRFVLLGDGNTRSELEAMGGNTHLQFIDPLPDDGFHAALASADILLVNERPGLTEMSLPSKLTTYFATGLPVIAAVDRSSTTFDELTAAGAGPTVPAGDAAALLAAAERLAADPETSSTAGRAGRRYRDELLSESAAVAAFTRVVDAVLTIQPSVAETAENSTAWASA